jgi:hypothetical protein
MNRDLRKSSWYPFSAPGELFVENSDHSHTTRLTELSHEGCHLVLGNPLPPGTAVWALRLSRLASREIHACDMEFPSSLTPVIGE